MRVAFEDERMCIRTRCRDTEQLIGTFKSFVSGTSLFVSALATRPVDTEAMFEVSLVDGTVVMRGRGVIRQIWSNTDNPFRRAGTLVAIRTLTRSSKVIFDRMLGRQAVPDPTSIPIPRTVPTPPAPPAPDTAFVTDSGTWLGRPPEGPRPGMWTEETDAFLDVLRAIPPREYVDSMRRSRRTTHTVPVKVTIPPRGARSDDAKPRIETARLVSVAVPRPPEATPAATPDPAPDATSDPALDETAGAPAGALDGASDATPEATPEETSAATTEPFFVPPDFVPTERNPRLTTADESGPHAPAPAVPVAPPSAASAAPPSAASAAPPSAASAAPPSAVSAAPPSAVSAAPSAAPEPYDAYEASMPLLRPARPAIGWPLAALVFAAAAAALFYTRADRGAVIGPPRAHAATFDLKVMRRPVTDDGDRMTFDVVVTPPCAVERK